MSYFFFLNFTSNDLLYMRVFFMIAYLLVDVHVSPSNRINSMKYSALFH